LQVTTKKNSTKPADEHADEHGCHHHPLGFKIWRVVECYGPPRYVFAVLVLVLAVVLTIHFVG